MEKTIDQDLFLERLRDFMIEKGFSQASLARAAEISPAVLSMYFSGVRAPSREALARLANVLGCSVDFLVGRKTHSEIYDLCQHDKVQTLVAEFSRLSAHDQDRIMDMIHLLLTSEKPE